MGLFHKNSNESNFAGGSKNIMESIQNDYQGSDILVKRDSREDFNTGSVINVNPGEQAVFVKNGEIMGVLDKGRHELSTENYPFLSRIRNMLSGGVSTFPCRVFYVRTAHTKIEWGTPNGIQYQDNWFKCPTVAKGNGEYWITFKNIPTFIEKLMGNELMYTADQLHDAFLVQISGRMTQIVAKRLEELTKTTEITAFNGMKDELVGLLQNDLQDLLDEYGLELKRFVINNFEIEDNDIRNAAISAVSLSLAESRARVQDAQGKLAELNVLGDQYQRIKGMDLLQTLAENPGAGGVASAGAGLGMGMAAGSAFAGIAQSVFTDNSYQRHSEPQTSFGGTSRFGMSGQDTPASSPVADPVEILKKMKTMLDAGLISQAQYDQKVAEIMSRL